MYAIQKAEAGHVTGPHGDLQLWHQERFPLPPPPSSSTAPGLKGLSIACRREAGILGVLSFYLPFLLPAVQ